MTNPYPTLGWKKISADIAWALLVSLYLPAVVVFLWRTPALASGALAAGCALQLAVWPSRANAVIMIAAAALGMPSEMASVRLGVWTYDAPGLVMGVPIWIGLVWANLFGLFRRLAILAHVLSWRLWPGARPRLRRAVFSLLYALILAYFLFTVFNIARPIALIYTAFMLPFIFFWRSERLALIFIIGGAIGTLGEYICMLQGFWVYHFPYFRSLGLPLSLPLAWGLSGLITWRIAMAWERKNQVR